MIFDATTYTKEDFIMSAQRIRGGFLPYSLLAGTHTTLLKKHNQSDVTSTTSIQPAYRPDVGDICYDYVTPRFKERVAKGEIINNPFHKHTTRVTDQYFTGLRTRYWWTGTLNVGDTKEAFYSSVNDRSPLPSPGLTIPWDYSLELQEVINQAYIKSYQQDVMGLVDIAEIGKTADLIRESLALIELLVRKDLREYRQFRRNQRNQRLRQSHSVLEYYGKTAAGKAADASNLFLAYTYGVKPLMSTIEGLLATLTEKLEPVRNTFRSSRKYDKIATSSTTLFADPWGEGSVIVGTRNEYLNMTFEMRAGVLTDFKATTADRLGLTGHNIPSAFYELVPFSFVLDWIWALGPAITALTPHPSFRTLASWSVLIQTITRHTETVRISATQHSNAGTGHFEYYPYTVSCRIEDEYKTRTPGVTPGIPYPKIQFSDLPHLLNGLALGFSSLKRTSLARL